jgi:DNA-binding winged helix-turn-helix (wHTH) protein
MGDSYGDSLARASFSKPGELPARSLMDQNAPRSSDKVFCFDGFEANRECYQLQRNGCAVKLERIPLELLFLLLEHRGKLVDREQIVSTLWRDDSFIDTERSINTAVRKIRKALGDDAHHPQFVETIVGKGYRFIARLAAENEMRNLPVEIQTGAPPALDETNGMGSEIRLRGFRVETNGGRPILSCEVMVGEIALGRIPLLEIELPANITLPLKRQDRLVLNLYGARVTLTASAVQALHAFSISILQSGLRTRASDSLGLGKKPLEQTSVTAGNSNAGQFSPP